MCLSKFKKYPNCPTNRNKLNKTEKTRKMEGNKNISLGKPHKTFLTYPKTINFRH